jgi:peptidoglycan/xylan/chitin deacetylase (PgdA/CDA1 family)
MSLASRIALSLGALAVSLGGAFFLLHTPVDQSEAAVAHEQAAYAEVSTTPLPAAALEPSATTTSFVPIVVYHIVRPAYPDDTPGVRALAQTPEVFDAQMGYLAKSGYRVISFSDLEAHLTTGASLPAKPIIISFDDGWSDQFEYAFPILKKYGFTATFFVFTNPIGTRGFLTWAELKEIADAGMTIGSHTRSHPFLTKITDPAKLWREIDGSKQTIEQHLGVSVREFAYPFGQYDPAIIALVEKAGYASARGDLASRAQTAAERFTLGAMNAPTTLAGFTRAF